MRVSLRLSSESMTIIEKLKKEMLEERGINVTTGFVCSTAFEELEISKKPSKFWNETSKQKLVFDEAEPSAVTTINLRSQVADEYIPLLQREFAKEFCTDRVFPAFVLRMVLKAYYLQKHENFRI